MYQTKKEIESIAFIQHIHKLFALFRKGSRKKIKNSTTNGQAFKRWGRGVRAWPLRKKELFLKLFLFLFCCHLKIKIMLLLTTYRNMDISY